MLEMTVRKGIQGRLQNHISLVAIVSKARHHVAFVLLIAREVDRTHVALNDDLN